MEHRDEDVDEVIKGMLEDRRANPKGRIDRQKYISKGYLPNDVRKAAEAVAEIWPILDKYGNVLESEETIRKLNEAYRSLEKRAQEQEKRIQENVEGKPQREELARKVRELEEKNAEKEKKYKEATDELGRLREEKSNTGSVDVDEIQRRLEKQQKDIERLNEEASERDGTIAEMRQQLEQRYRDIRSLQEKNDQLNDASTKAESECEKKIIHKRSRFKKMFTVETGVLAILLVLLFVSHGMEVIARGMIMTVRSLTATMIDAIHLVASTLKLIALGALHYIELHLSLFLHSLVSSLEPVAVFSLIVLLILLIAGTANKR